MPHKFLLIALATGCLLDEPLDELSSTTSELADPLILPSVPGPSTPSGYGHYCSVTDPTNGGWLLGAVSSNTSDPCVTMARQVGPGAVVQRAGLFAIAGQNQVMARCDHGMVTGRAYGANAITWIRNQVSPTDTNCIFTIAPTKLPVWGPPFTATPSGTSVFDYDYTNAGWNVADFGGVPSGQACSMDRTGTQTGTRDFQGGCISLSVPGRFAAVEPAYDWALPTDTPLRAVADGVIRASYARTTAPMCNGSNQLELFLETQVGTGRYAEHFVAAYHHMNPTPNLGNPTIAVQVAAWGGKPMAPAGTMVKKGDVIGYVGSSGCSTTPHLDLSVLRTTNLTGARAYAFQALETTYDAAGNALVGSTGVNGTPGIIDPFGWAGAQNIDPMAFKYIGYRSPDQVAAIADAGAFGIKLWEKVRLPNGQVLYDVANLLPHNGGDAW